MCLMRQSSLHLRIWFDCEFSLLFLILSVEGGRKMDTRQENMRKWKSLKQFIKLTPRFWIRVCDIFWTHTHTQNKAYTFLVLQMISMRILLQLLATQFQCQPWQGLISILSIIILYWEFCRWWRASEQTDDHRFLISTTPEPNYFNAFKNQSVVSAK